LHEFVDDARIGEKGGMQINKAEVLSLVVYVQLWAQRFVSSEHLFLARLLSRSF